MIMTVMSKMITTTVTAMKVTMTRIWMTMSSEDPVKTRELLLSVMSGSRK